MLVNITRVINKLFIVNKEKHLITASFLLLSVTLTFAQSNIDSLKRLAKNESYNVKINALMELFSAYRLKDLDSALYFAELSNENALKVADSLMIVRTEIAIGYVYQEKGFYQQAIQYYEKALNTAKKNNYRDREKFVLNYLGITNYYVGKYDEALEYHIQSLSLREEDENPLEIAIACNNIGLVYYQMKDFNNAISFFRRSLEIKKSIKDDNKIESTLINLGLCYSGLSNYDDALSNFRKVLDICEKVGCEQRIRIEALNGAGLAFFSLENFEEAEENLLKSNTLAIEGGFSSYVVVNLHYLAQIKFQRSLIKEALQLLNESQALANKLGDRIWLNKNYRLYSKIYSLLNNYELAYEYQEKYDSLNNLILNEEVIQNLAKIQIAYQERENLETINLQRTELTRRTTLLILSIIIIFLALAILILLFRNNQQRKKVNRKLSEANETIEKQNAELTNMNLVLEERVRERTQELNASNAALLKSNTELDNFIYKTSHDIRGPLATLQGMCNVALMDIEDQKSIEYFNKLGKTAQRLNEILSKLLVINQINNSLISDEPIDFENILRVAVNDQQNSGISKKIHVKEEIETNLNFRSDEDLVKIIVTNLVTNAFKFHNTSERVDSFVSISIARCDHDKICLRVIDNGIGIDEKVSSKIFEIFSKASDMSDTAGLGLYLVKLAVEKLEGQIELTKTEEDYTCFSVILPYYH